MNKLSKLLVNGYIERVGLKVLSSGDHQGCPDIHDTIITQYR